ncbi:MAG: rhodanese-related sulfurtransferase, partial [Chlamydiia bacterium]|nr:rhodanese-related sulfurtransferase [Chlamydiia bacterium]
MTNTHPYLVLSHYRFYPLEHPEEELELHRNFFANRDVKARIYFSTQGINCQMSAATADAEAYMEWMRSRPGFENHHFNLQGSEEHAFPRLCLKVKSELVALDLPFDSSMEGDYLAPREWAAYLEKIEQTASTDPEAPMLLDIRNDYEWEVGHFQGAEKPPCRTFRHFPAYIKKLSERENAHDRPVLISCTGGIRCEVFSSLLKASGFKRVYQLKGGVINYGNAMGNTRWEGKLFVFDDRMTVPIAESGEPVSQIGECYFCGCKCDQYFNCANMECNTLFLSCDKCIYEKKGCCTEECCQAPRRRPLDSQPLGRPYS